MALNRKLMPVSILYVTVLVLSVSFELVGAAWNTTCPSPCHCSLEKSVHSGRLLRTVQCVNKKLKEIPRDLPPGTQALLLKSNAISTIHNQLPQSMALRELDLSYNSIEALGPHPIFQNLTSLHYLNLDHNQIRSLLHGSFSGLKNLDDLVLSSNRIDSVEEHSFGGLNHLRTLQLDNNKLSGLNAKWLTDMASLTTLILNNNQLKRLNDGVFTPMKKLTKLSFAGNALLHLKKATFKGLEKLQSLILDKNAFSEIPTRALTALKSLKILSLNGNPVIRIGKRDFQDLNVMKINLNAMPQLQTVDKDAFYNLPRLTILQLHDNDELTFIDPYAFYKTPKLRMLYLHNNNLMALPQDLVRNLPKLKEVSIYGNQLHCDCNIYWIKHLLNTTNVSQVTLQEPDKLRCFTPQDLAGKLVKNVPLEKIKKVCAPTVIPFFNDSYQKELGDSITFECRAIGVPYPHIHWILSNGKVVNNTSNYSRVRLDTAGTLTVEHLKATDAGTYTCIATNALFCNITKGYCFDTTSSVLKIHNKNIHILLRGVATNFITVTWNGTDSTMGSSNYQILYRKSGSNAEYGRIHLHQYMRTYTITKLEPHTTYEFCMAYEHHKEINKLNCMDIETQSRTFVMQGIHRFSNMTVLIALSSTATVILTLCLGLVLIKRYRRRKAYKEPEGNAAKTTVNYKVDTMSQIPLDNLYNPPSTPICTSRTSLIGSTSHSNA